MIQKSEPMVSKIVRFSDSVFGTLKTFGQSLSVSPLVLIHIAPEDSSADQLTPNKV